MIVQQIFTAGQPPDRLAAAMLDVPPGAAGLQVRAVVLPAKQWFASLRRAVERQSDMYLWFTLPQLRRGALYDRLLRWEAEGFPPPEGVLVAAPRVLLPEDADDLCPAIEYYGRFALSPSLFCILTRSPALGPALEQAWGRFCPR